MAYAALTESFLPPFDALTYFFLYRTIDGGASWQQLSLAGANAIAIDPVSSRLYVGIGDGVFRSDDFGETFQGPFGTAGVVELAIDPIAPSTIYAASSDTGVNKSTDSGFTWGRINSGIADTRGASSWSIAVDPNDPKTLYTAAFAGSPNTYPATTHIFKTVDGGANWTLVKTLGEVRGAQVRVAATQPSSVYVLASNQILRSVDGGISWSDITEGLAPPLVIQVSPGSPETLYAGTLAGLFEITFLSRPDLSRRPRTRVVPPRNPR